MDLGQGNHHNNFSRIFIYQTLARCFLVASDKFGQHWRILKFDKQATLGELDATEDPVVYSKTECAALLKQINDGNLQHGGLQLVCRAYGIIGCFKFLEGYYLLLVTKKRFVGILQDQKVYGIDGTALVPLISSSVHKEFARDKEAAAAEQRYRKLLAGISLNTDFYFSYSLPLWLTVQRSSGGEDVQASAFSSDRVWNEWLTRPLREALGHDRWVLPLVHGFWQQRRLAIFGRTLTLTLIARRSRQFAGTRYLKRGVSDAGYVANDVEIEQVLDVGQDWRTGKPLVSSMVQVRGSIPLYWVQSVEGGVLKPDIVLQRFDPLYQATARHFEDLRCRYGNPVMVLNLVRQMERHPRETVLGREFAAAVAHLNKQAPTSERVQYAAWDLSRHAKTDSRHLLQNLQGVLAPLLRATGLFVSRAMGGGGGSQQRGVLRTNCIDCLDRTNVAQFAAGLLGLGRQLHALGISEGPALDPDSSIARQLMDAYESMGHCLSQQYGGSEAHTTFFQRQRGDWEPATQSRDMLTSLRRFYSNTYTDAEKQDSLNLFLGSFVPRAGAPHVWDLGSDQYLHTGGGMAGLAQRLFLGATAGATARSRQSAASTTASAPPSRPPSREGSFDLSPSKTGTAAAGSAGVGGGGGGSSATAMVSLSSSRGGRAQGSSPPASRHSLESSLRASPSQRRSFDGGQRLPGAAAAAGPQGSTPAGTAGSALGPGLEPEDSGEGPSTPPLEGPLGASSSLRLTVSTDWVEVPTLTQLVEGASPSWHAASAAEASMEPLSLDQDQDGLVMGGHPAGGAGQGGGEGQGEGSSRPGGEEGGQEDASRLREAAAGAGAGVAGVLSGPSSRQAGWQDGLGGGQSEPLLLPPSAAPARSPRGGAGVSPFASPTKQRALAAPCDKAEVQHAQQGVAGARKPPPSPRRHKLESFDKLIYKGPNAVRQVRLTASPASTPKQSPLTSWLPSPSRVKSKRPPTPPAPPNAAQAAAGAAGPSPAVGRRRPPLSPQKQHSQHPYPLTGPATSPAQHAQQQLLGSASPAVPAGATPLVWPGSSPLWHHPPPFLGTLPLSPMSSPPSHRVLPVRLVRSSSDSTLLAALGAELSDWQAICHAPQLQPAPLPTAAPPRSLDDSFLQTRMEGGRHATSAASLHPPLAPVPRRSSTPGLLHSVSASAVDLADYASEAALFGAEGADPWGPPSSHYSAPPKVPTGSLVVLDAWAGGGGRPTLAVQVDGSWAEAASALPGSPPASRKTRFSSFSLQGLKRTLTPRRVSSALEASTQPFHNPRSGPTPGPSSAVVPAVPLPPSPATCIVGGAADLGLWASPPPDPLGLLGGGGGVDPVAAMLAEEQRLREQYARHVQALSTPPTLDQSRALEHQLAALTRPSWSLSLGGDPEQGWGMQGGEGWGGGPPRDQTGPANRAQHAQSVL